MYTKIHKDWKPCSEEILEPCLQEPVRTRSRMIAQGTGITLAEALCDIISDSQSIDIAVSFIFESGLNLLIDSLRDAAEAGRRIRVITTAYMHKTEYEAVAELADLPNAEVRMELNPNDSHLHAKCFLFTSEEGNGTAFVGSANISKSALTSGEELVAMIREEDLPAVVEDLRSEFERLWSSPRFEKVTRKDRARIERAVGRRGD
ncbi:MAG: hypothetical protein IKR86_11955 [Candidatus Methanomethylophilaceae archaeon]|nr:hypothetical protein [Candidatus Methanomethylophilaceae archaeon]